MNEGISIIQIICFEMFLNFVFMIFLFRRVGRGSRLVGSGSAVPKTLISNEALSKFVDTSDEWISVRTGIRNRRVLGG